MKSLLQAVQARLTAEASLKGVEIVPEETFLPEYAMLPWAGLKDAGLAKKELAGGVVEETLTVRVLVYAEHARSTADMAGAGLDAAADVDAALSGWTPDGYLFEGRLVGEIRTGAAQREEGGAYVQRAVFNYQFVREV